ncbi:MAG: L,D-transpeptidase family protein [Hyphomicrobiaceae bacterium]
MSKLLRVLATAASFLSLSFGPGVAVEPDAPEKLISEQETFSIAVRWRIDKLPPTTNFGDLRDRAAAAHFYSHHVGPPLWVASDGMTRRAQVIAAEIRGADSWGLDSTEFNLPLSPNTTMDVERQTAAELSMTLAVIKYARHASGGRMDPKRLSLAIDRTPPLADPSVVLTELSTTDDPAASLRDLHPKHEQFQLLRTAYLGALSAEAGGSARANRRKTRSRKRRGRSSTKLSQRLLYNMEMWRWMPRELGQKYVWANIPEYKVRVVNSDHVIHEERIIAGKVKNKTPMFSDEMETIVFQPYWWVPNSIKVKELLPGLMRGRNTLRRKNLKISSAGREISPHSVDWSRTDIRNYRVFQPPGRYNALGVVKFLFPNEHAVYMHDTPSKYLFKRKRRAFSHGCVRVRDPLKLAEVVLGADKGLSRSQIDSFVNDGPENNQIRLDEKVPVHVTYFTARIDGEGQPVLFRDVYRHEKLIQMGFDGKAHLIVLKEPDLSPPKRKVVRRSQSRSKRRQVVRNRDIKAKKRAAGGRGKPKSRRRKTVRRPAKSQYSSNNYSATSSSSAWVRAQFQ